MTSFQSGRPMAPTLRPTAGPSRTTPGRYNEDMEQLIFRMHQMLIDELDADQISAMPPPERRKVVEQAAETLLRREMPSVGGITRDQIVSRVVDEVVGLGPIDALMRDPSISELMMNDLIAAQTIKPEMVEFLKACVHQKLNILISGGTGTGKTTFLNALSAYIPESERIVTIEDPVEMKLQQPHVVTMEARPANLDGKGEIAQRDLLRN